MSTLEIIAIFIVAAAFGSLVTLKLSRFEMRDQFEIEEFKKFTDVMKAQEKS